MFFDTLTTMLQKQDLSAYLFSVIKKIKRDPAFTLENFIVQVLTNDQVTDTITNFQAKLNGNY